MRIGILGHGFLEWGGGIDFLRVVASSLRHARPDVELIMLTPTRGPLLTARVAARGIYRTAKSILGLAKAGPSHVDATHIAELASNIEQGLIVHQVDIGNAAIATAGNRLGIDAIIPVMYALPAAFPIPWVGYLYDFQHRYFPQLFSTEDRLSRDTQFSNILRIASTVVVNAASVAADAHRFHPDARAQLFTLPFSAAPQAAWLECSDSPALRYGIKRPYFIICNQFWKHKDHATAFEAFTQFARTHPGIDLVCTGSTTDYRDPDYFASLQRAIADSRVSDRVHILGMVPKADQVALLKASIALVQPTLFEGGPGGGAVYDAVSLGVPSIVSDIAVNRELPTDGVFFFAAQDSASLSTALDAAISRPSATRRDAQSLRKSGNERRVACGLQLLAAIEHARGASRHSRT